jgi:hypothetical protein
MNKIHSGVLLCASVIGLADAANAQISVTPEAPGDETSIVPGVITETFNEFSTGPVSTTTGLATSIGTLTGGYIFAANEYGGAGGTGNFYAIGKEVGVQTTFPGILTFNGPQTYFGLWWSATDPQNSLTFYNGATPIETFTSAEITAGLSGAYLSNPSGTFAGQDKGEDFVYLNFDVTSGAPITSVQFNDGNETSTGFEMDNFSIIAPSKVPDAASTLTMLGLGSAGLTALGRRFRK